MSDAKTIEKAIQKAVDGGWQAPWGTGKWYPQEHSVNDIIFSHDFATALWGEQKAFSLERGWQSHLQQMVVADDPIEYLRENL